MRILLIHNRYLQEGGEEMTVKKESHLLRSAKEEVKLLTFDNSDLKGIPIWRRVWALFHNHLAIKAVRQAITSFKPDIVHVHNLFYYASPAILHTIHKTGCPLIMTLHNYRLLCVNGQLLRKNQICERCLPNRWPKWGVYYGCFHQSRSRSLLLQLILSYHKQQNTFEYVDKFLVLSEFAKSRFVKSSLGLTSSRFSIHGSSATERSYVNPLHRNRRFLYVGRLSVEKGIEFLLHLFEKNSYTIDIIGNGKLSSQVKATASAHPDRIHYHGHQPPHFIHQQMASCRALLFPSIWYEGLPNVIPEAYAQGTPIISSDNASLRQFILHEKSGLLCPARALIPWQAALKRIQSEDKLHEELCQGARSQYEDRFTQKQHTQRLLKIYQEVIETKHPRSQANKVSSKAP